MPRKTGRNTKGRIVSAAWKLFYEQGYDNTTVEDIIFESETSKGSFYHYFEGKDALLGSLSMIFDEKYETLRQEIGSGYDVITANIVADVIKGMAPLFPGFLKDNGILILSGIITERADEVLDTVTAYDFAVLERREASGWCAVKLQKLAGAGTSCDTVRK